MEDRGFAYIFEIRKRSLTKILSALIHIWQIQQFILNRESFWIVKTGLVVPVRWGE